MLDEEIGVGMPVPKQVDIRLSKVEQYLKVDVGDGQSWPHSLSQISKARNSFQPRSMLSFVQHLALTPMNVEHRTLDFIKNEATVLAWRMAQYDGTYVCSSEGINCLHDI